MKTNQTLYNLPINFSSSLRFLLKLGEYNDANPKNRSSAWKMWKFWSLSVHPSRPILLGKCFILNAILLADNYQFHAWALVINNFWKQQVVFSLFTFHYFSKISYEFSFALSLQARTRIAKTLQKNHWKYDD